MSWATDALAELSALASVYGADLITDVRSRTYIWHQSLPTCFYEEFGTTWLNDADVPRWPRRSDGDAAVWRAGGKPATGVLALPMIACA